MSAAASPKIPVADVAPITDGWVARAIHDRESARAFAFVALDRLLERLEESGLKVGPSSLLASEIAVAKAVLAQCKAVDP